MMIYAFPVLLAGIAFAVNEGFDRVFLRMLLPEETADATIGIYSACYKMGVFMNLFVSAFKLGVEPFFSVVLKTRMLLRHTPTLLNISLYVVVLY